MSVNSRFKATKIIGQRKTFYRQRIPESSCARKKTVCIDILVTSRNGDKKIMKSNRITSNNIYIYIYIYIYIASCYGSITLALVMIGRDGFLTILVIVTGLLLAGVFHIYNIFYMLYMS